MLFKCFGNSINLRTIRVVLCLEAKRSPDTQPSHFPISPILSHYPVSSTFPGYVIFTFSSQIRRSPGTYTYCPRPPQTLVLSWGRNDLPQKANFSRGRRSISPRMVLTDPAALYPRYRQCQGQSQALGFHHHHR